MWEECRHFDTHIQAAIEARLPPKAVIFNDPSHTEYDAWDFKLIKSHYFLKNMMDGEYPVWISESSRVGWDAERKISRPRAAIDRAQQQDSDRIAKSESAKATPGQYYVAKPKILDDGGMPTLQEWLKSREKGEAETGTAIELPEGAGVVKKGKFGQDIFVPGNSENFMRPDDYDPNQQSVE